MLYLVITPSDILRSMVRALGTPILIVLIIIVILTIVLFGTLIAEWAQRLYIDVKAAKLVDIIKKGDVPIEQVISESKILTTHKRLLFELLKHKTLSPSMRENLAVSILENYNIEQDKIIKRTDLIMKLGPTFGLLGTLSPLGPGIIALSTGDTQTLSQSLLVAFDTTIIGLVCAAICTIISMIRRRWYSKDRIMLELLMEAIVESENKGKK